MVILNKFDCVLKYERLGRHLSFFEIFIAIFSKERMELGSYELRTTPQLVDKAFTRTVDSWLI